MRIRRRLSDSEATFLQLTIKEKINGKGNPKYELTKKQLEQIVKLRKQPQELTVKSETKPNDYKEEKKFVLSAWNYKTGKIMPIDEYCDTYNLPKNDITSFKFLPHHYSEPSYNIVFKEKEFLNDDFDYLGELRNQISNYKFKNSFNLNHINKEGIITITDLHFGAYISAMIKTPDFNISILCDMLESAAIEVNRFNYKITHVHLLGDLIESFTGLNHKNSWKGLDKGMFGVSAIKLFTELFIKHFLSKINNLGTVKIVAGNHDRVTSDNNEDVDGGAAELIAWGLEILGYDVEFSTSVITHVVDNICNILNHGHHAYTKKKSTQEMCWDYGVKGMFNYIKEGHLHSRIKKLNAIQIKNFKMISDDNIDCRREVCPSLFTGNSFSEYGGWSTLAGFQVSEANIRGNGVNVFDFSL